MTCLLARKKRVLVVIQSLLTMLPIIMAVCTAMCSHLCLTYEQRSKNPKSHYRLYQQLSFLYDLVFKSDVKCLSQLRMDRQTLANYVSLFVRKEVWLVVNM